MAMADESVRSFRFRLGLWLVAGGTVSGIPGACLGTLVGMLAGRPVAGMFAGVAVYVLSWLMIGAGVVLAGPGALAGTRRLLHYLRKRSTSGGCREPPS